jgi:bacteriocin biosynthesis cyclodehydratase domain-containing protein
MTQTADSAPGVAAGDERFRAVRPRLRHDVVFAETGDGVLLRDSDNGFVVKGKSAYRLASLMFPFLNGEHSVDDLCAGLSPAHRGMVLDMVRTLLDRGLARDARPALPGTLVEAVRQRFSPQLNFIDHYADDPERRFRAFRTARVLVAGVGETAAAAAVSLLRNGLERLDLTCPGAAIPAGPLRAAAELTEEGCPAVIRAVARSANDLAEEDLAGYDVILLTAGFGGDLAVDQLLRLTSRPRPGGSVLMPAVTAGHRVIAGPLVRAGASPCWACALLRLDRNLEPAAMSAVWRAASLPGIAADDPGLSQPAARMLGNMLAFDVFRLRTGALPAELDGSIVVQDLDTLESVREHVLPHPDCPVCRAAGAAPGRRAPAGPAPEPGELTPGELTDRRQKALYGRYAGIIREFTDGPLSQSPVKAARMRIGLPGGADREITAFDLHTAAAARARALDAAAVVYADSLASVHHAVRRSGSGHDGNGARAAHVADQALLTWTGLAAAPDAVGPGGRERIWLPATSLATGDTRYVPAAAVYPFSALNSPGRFERTGAGAAAGRTSAEANQAGLRSAVGYLALRNSMAQASAALAVQPGALGDDPEIRFLLETVETFGRQLTMFRLPAGPVQVLLAVTDGQGPGGPGWAIGTGDSARDAGVAALRDLAGIMQTADADGPGAPDIGLELLPDFDPRTIRSSLGDPGPAVENGAGDVVGWLLAAGYDALAVDTTPLDLRGTGLFTTVRVLLCRV